MLHRGTLAFCHTVWRYAAINLMTIALILAGAGVFGAAPALCAGCWAISRRDARNPGQLAAGMWRQWRAEFVRANLALWPLAGVTVAALLVASRAGGSSPAVASAIVVALLSLQFALATGYGISQREGGVVDAFGNGARLFMASPWRLLALLAILMALGLVAIWQPLFALYGLLSVSARAAVALLGDAFASPVETAAASARSTPSRKVQPQEIRA